MGLGERRRGHRPPVPAESSGADSGRVGRGKGLEEDWGRRGGPIRNPGGTADRLAEEPGHPEGGQYTVHAAGGLGLRSQHLRPEASQALGESQHLSVWLPGSCVKGTSLPAGQTLPTGHWVGPDVIWV